MAQNELFSENAIEIGINFGQTTGSTLDGIAVGALTCGISLVTGDNLSKINGMIPLDKIEKLSFDATFGYGANMLHTAVVQGLENVSKPRVSTRTITDISLQINSRRNANDSIYYQNKTAEILGIY